MTAIYTTSATSYGPRRGRATTADGQLDVQLDLPPELGGRGAGTNPEQLFAAGYAACFHAAVARVAKRLRLSASGGEVTAEVSLVPGPADGFGLSVRLAVHLPELDRAQAEDVVRRSHEMCPYSNATRGNIDVSLSIADAPAARAGAL